MNEPGNRMTPTMLAERAQKMAQEVGLKCEVYGAEKIKALKMGAFWSVAQGSDEPPALIVLTYEPQGAPDRPVDRFRTLATPFSGHRGNRATAER